MRYTGREKNRKKTLVLSIILALAVVLLAAALIFFAPDIWETVGPWFDFLKKPDNSAAQNSYKLLYDDIKDIKIEKEGAPEPVGDIITDDGGEAASQEGFLRTKDNTIKYEPMIEEVADKDFFKGSLFVGDAITEGLSIYKTAGEAKIISAKGMNAANALNYLSKIKESGAQRVYLLIGLNDVTDTLPIDTLVSRYKLLLVNLKEALPDAKLYVQAVFPVSKAVDEGTRNSISLSRIKEYNDAVSKLAFEKGVNFIDTYSIFADENGYIEKEITYDGIYLRPEYYPFWINMLCENSGERVPK